MHQVVLHNLAQRSQIARQIIQQIGVLSRVSHLPRLGIEIQHF
jgi:hypothetical protein